MTDAFAPTGRATFFSAPAFAPRVTRRASVFSTPSLAFAAADHATIFLSDEIEDFRTEAFLAKASAEDPVSRRRASTPAFAAPLAAAGHKSDATAGALRRPSA